MISTGRKKVPYGVFLCSSLRDDHLAYIFLQSVLEIRGSKFHGLSWVQCNMGTKNGSLGCWTKKLLKSTSRLRTILHIQCLSASDSPVLLAMTSAYRPLIPQTYVSPSCKYTSTNYFATGVLKWRKRDYLGQSS